MTQNQVDHDLLKTIQLIAEETANNSISIQNLISRLDSLSQKCAEINIQLQDIQKLADQLSAPASQPTLP